MSEDVQMFIFFAIVTGLFLVSAVIIMSWLSPRRPRG